MDRLSVLDDTEVRILGVPTRERITRLEEEAARLGTELEELKRAFAEFKSQF